MSYAITDIINWAKICQPLAKYNETKKKAVIGGSQESDLDVQIYNARKDLEYSYAQDPTTDQTFQIGQYVLALCGVYLFQAQGATGSGGSITPISPSTVPDPYEFEVSASSFIPTGDSTKTITAFIGYNILFVRNNITQSTIDQGAAYFSWDRNTGDFALLNGAANVGELFQIYAI